MIVIKANPEKRTVSEISAETALVEYAGVLGLLPKQVTTNTYAANPLLVRIGDTHHVRGILRAEEDGTLEFASAIDALHVNHTMTGVAIHPPLERCIGQMR